jgi:hypothetical protein
MGRNYGKHEAVNGGKRRRPNQGRRFQPARRFPKARDTKAWFRTTDLYDVYDGRIGTSGVPDEKFRSSLDRR